MAKFFTPKNIISTVAQIIIVYFALPIVLILMERMSSGFSAEAVVNSVSDIPFVGGLISLGKSLVDLKASGDYELQLPAILQLLNKTMVDAMIIGMIMLLIEELFGLLSIPGIPLIQYVLGAVLGVIAVTAFDAGSLMYKTMVVAFLTLVGVILILFTAPGQRFKKALCILFIAFQSIVAAYTVLFCACVLRFASLAEHTFGTLVDYVLVPGLGMLAFAVLSFIFRPKKGLNAFLS